MPASGLLHRGERNLKRLTTATAQALLRSRTAPPLDPLAVRNILVVRQHNQLGDMLCAVPLLRALRSRFPSSAISLITSPVNNAVMLHHALLDEVINFDKREFLSQRRIRLGALRGFVHSLRSRRYDLAIVPSTVSMSFTSDLLAYLSGGRWRIGAGSLEGKENPGSIFYTHPVQLSWAGQPHRHQTLRNLDVGKELGLSVPDLHLEMTLLTGEQAAGCAEVERVRLGARGVVAFHPGAGKPPNRWPSQAFGRIMHRTYQELNCRILIIKGPMDDVPVDNLVSSLDVPYYLVENQDIRHVASILNSVDLLVSNDTGIMHVGAAVGTPVLSLFGPTDPLQWAPPGPRNRYIWCKSRVISDIHEDEVFPAMDQMLREHILPAEGTERR